MSEKSKETIKELQEKLLSKTEELEDAKKKYEKMTDDFINERIEFSATKKEIENFTAEYKRNLRQLKDEKDIYLKKLEERTADLINLRKEQEEIFAVTVDGFDKVTGKLTSETKKAMGQLLVDLAAALEEKKTILATMKKRESETSELKKEIEELLGSATDVSIHGAFAKKGEEYTRNYEKHQAQTTRLMWAMISNVALFSAFRMMGNTDELLFVSQIAITAILAYGLWFVNRNLKLDKKLAENYHHKSTLSSSLMGYRKIHDLSHKDTEYTDQLKRLTGELNHNPSKDIDTFLNSSHPLEGGAVFKILTSFSPKQIETISENWDEKKTT